MKTVKITQKIIEYAHKVLLKIRNFRAIGQNFSEKMRETPRFSLN